MTPEVTVVITTHNRRAMLRDAIASVRSQSGVTWELIVADDGSTDGTAAWLEAELRAPSERLLARPAAGRPHTANSAVSEASGRYLLFLDDDDELLPGALATLAGALDDAPRASAAIGARMREIGGTPRRMSHPSRQMVRDASLDLLAWWSAVPGQALVRTSALRSVGGYPEHAWPADDRGLLMGLAAIGEFVFVPDPVMKYRIHGGQHAKPEGMSAIRERVAADGVRRLPPERRHDGIAAWVAGQRRERANTARERGRPGRALALYLGAACTSPKASRSPVIWPSLARGVLDSGRQLLTRR